jgi:hypothetical protein
MAWALHVEERLGEPYRAAAGGAQLNLCERVYLKQDDVLGEFILPLLRS